MTSTESFKLIKPKSDWSRSSRNKINLLKAGSDPQQLKITSFSKTVDDVERVLKEHPHMSVLNRDLCQSKEHKGNKHNLLIKRLMANAEKNAIVLPNRKRHEEVLKKFATSLFIYCGPLSYEFLHRNMSNALPSLRTVQRIVSDKYNALQEGKFRFDELLIHINSYKASKMIAIGEDATRIISRVKYDNATNKLVGFVLPCGEDGLPISSAFLANSFQAIQTSFQDGEIARYAFVYMAQSLTDGVPAFCLACLGTDNKFTAEVLSKRWRYIFTECKKRGISVVSFGADGDSRELKSMQSSSQLQFSSKISSNSISCLDSAKVSIPAEWSNWFGTKNPTKVAYVQDIVHVAVKLKARLLCPSIVLPLGRFLAGVHHLRILFSTFGKDQHGLREKDINHKDKQNYDAVLHITSKCVMSLLGQIPDAQGTLMYLKLIRNVIDSYLDKELSIVSRIQKAWYAVFFVRYWRCWLVHSEDYTLGNNFITHNAYVCIELNAHALILYLLTVRETGDYKQFLPWKLGSQSCESIFRAARSLSSTFSTMINFDMLGLLQRIHRIHVKFCLEAECAETGIKYPHIECHKNKDGHNIKKGMRNQEGCGLSDDVLSSSTNTSISRAVESGKNEAQTVIESLGMAQILKEKKCWEYPPIPNMKAEDIKDEDDLNEGVDICSDCEDGNDFQNSDNILCSINKLEKEGFVEKDLKNRLVDLHSSTFKKLSGTGLPLYDIEQSNNKSGATSKFCPYVKISHNDKDLFIHKTTAVWLLQEGERVSSDRLFRVREKQPLVKNHDPKVCHFSGVNPVVCNTIEVGNICVFKNAESWRIGKVLQFSYYKEKTKKSQQYSGNVVDLSKNFEHIGVLCSWFAQPTCNNTLPVAEPSEMDVALLSPNIHSKIPVKLSLSVGEEAHTFWPLTSYICSLSLKCFESVEGKAIEDSIMKAKNSFNLETAQHLTLKASSVLYIEELVKSRTVSIDHKKNETKPSHRLLKENWVTHGCIVLTTKDKQEILRGKQLNDMHVNAFQNLLKKEFGVCIGGFMNTLLQNRVPLELEEDKMVLQVIHVRGCHWAALQVNGKDDICYYDSLYDSLSQDTFEVIAQLVHSDNPVLNVKIMNMARQNGSTDCALFALATLTCICLGMDPQTAVFDQDELRSHYISMLESEIVASFPIKKKRRFSNPYKLDDCPIYCYCRLPDDGHKMIACDRCDEWYHLRCIEIDKENDLWYCKKCLPNI